MDTKLQTFIEVTKTKNLTKAAEYLNLTQPAVSQHIKQLQQEYDVILFTRKNNELILTREGEVVLKYALRIQSLYANLASKITDAKKYGRNLTVGITHTSESNVAPEILAQYSSENNSSHIKIISDSIKNLYDKLLDYQIDFAIIEGKVTNRKLSSVLLGTDSLVVVVNPLNPIAQKKIVTIEDLKKQRLILRTLESGTATLFLSELAKRDTAIDQFNIYLEIDSVASIKQLIRKNLGISILPRSACFREAKEKTLVCLPIEDMDLSRETNLVFLKENVDREALEQIVSIYRNRIY